MVLQVFVSLLCSCCFLYSLICIIGASSAFCAIYSVVVRRFGESIYFCHVTFVTPVYFIPLSRVTKVKVLLSHLPLTKIWLLSRKLKPKEKISPYVKLLNHQAISCKECQNRTILKIQIFGEDRFEIWGNKLPKTWVIVL